MMIPCMLILLNIFDTLMTWSVLVVMMSSCNLMPLVVENVDMFLPIVTEPDIIFFPGMEKN